VAIWGIYWVECTKPRKRWQILAGYCRSTHALWNSTGLISSLLLAIVGVVPRLLTAAILKRVSRRRREHKTLPRGFRTPLGFDRSGWLRHSERSLNSSALVQFLMSSPEVEVPAQIQHLPFGFLA